VHSATKYYGGHSDVTAGLVCGSEARLRPVRERARTFGVAPDPHSTWLLERGVKTLAVRMERHCSNAMAVAEMLANMPGVAAVHYPGLASFAQHDLASRQMPGYGAMIAFELSGGIEAGRRMMDRLEMIARAVSLGDAETLIQHPASMTHSTYTPEERAAHGISDGLIRLSVGLEDVDDILDDLRQALHGS